jgi:hypothetical protein
MFGMKKVYGTSSVRLNGKKIKRIEYDGESDGHRMVLNVIDNGYEKQFIIPETNMQDFYNKPLHMRNHMQRKKQKTKKCNMKPIRINPRIMPHKRMQPRLILHKPMQPRLILHKPMQPRIRRRPRARTRTRRYRRRSTSSRSPSRRSPSRSRRSRSRRSPSRSRSRRINVNKYK